MSNEVGTLLVIACLCFIVADYLRRKYGWKQLSGSQGILIFPMNNAPASVKKNAMECGAETARYAVAIESGIEELPWFLRLDKTQYRTHEGIGVLILYILPEKENAGE